MSFLEIAFLKKRKENKKVEEIKGRLEKPDRGNCRSAAGKDMEAAAKGYRVHSRQEITAFH